MSGPIDDGGVAFEDLTARARIREAALKHFAEEGYERATIRAIRAQRRGVTGAAPPPLRVEGGVAHGV